MPNIPSTLPIQPSPRKTKVVPAWLVGFVLLACSPFTPSTALAQTLLQRVTAAEAQPKIIPFPILPGRPGVPTVIESPRHGIVTLGSGQAVYTPVSDYMGRDSFQITFPTSSGSRVVRYEVRVLPRYIPLAATYLLDQQTPALYDTWSRSFILCDSAVATPENAPLNCWRLLTKFVPPGNYFPIVWPQTNGLDLLALYAQETGLLYFLKSNNGYLEVREVINLAPMTGGWPVVGDWDASGQAELTMVFDDGRVFVLGPSSWELWPQRLKVPSDDETLWPVVWGHSIGPSLVYVSPKNGQLDWLLCAPTTGCTSGFLRSLATFDFRRAVGGFSLQFLVMTNSSLYMIPHRYSVLEPQTIPVKFPDDPPISGGGG